MKKFVILAIATLCLVIGADFVPIEETTKPGDAGVESFDLKSPSVDADQCYKLIGDSWYNLKGLSATTDGVGNDYSFKAKWGKKDVTLRFDICTSLEAANRCPGTPGKDGKTPNPKAVYANIQYTTEAVAGTGANGAGGTPAKTHCYSLTDDAGFNSNKFAEGHTPFGIDIEFTGGEKVPAWLQDTTGETGKSAKQKVFSFEVFVKCNELLNYSYPLDANGTAVDVRVVDDDTKYPGEVRFIVTGSSQNACPIFVKSSLTIFVNKNWVGFEIVFAVVGVILLFYGKRLVRFVIQLVIGASTTGGIMYCLFAYFIVEDSVTWGGYVIIVISVALGYLVSSKLWRKIKEVAHGAPYGVLLGYVIGNMVVTTIMIENADWFITYMTITFFMTLFAAITWRYHSEWWENISTAMGGSFLLVKCVSLRYIHTWPESGELQAAIFADATTWSKTPYTWNYMGAIIAVALVGSLVQSRLKHGDDDHDDGDHDDDEQCVHKKLLKDCTDQECIKKRKGGKFVELAEKDK